MMNLQKKQPQNDSHLHGKISQLEHQLSESTENAQLKKIQDYEMEINVFRNQIMELENSLKDKEVSLQKVIRQLKEQLEEANDSNVSLESIVNEHKLQIQTLQNKLSFERTQKQKNAETLKRLESESILYKNQIEIERSNKHNQELYTNKLQHQIEEMTIMLNSQIEIQKQIEDKKKEREKEIKIYQKKLYDETTKRTQIEKKTESEYQKKINEFELKLEEELKQKEEVENAMRAQLDQMKMERENLVIEVKVKEDNNKTLFSEMKKLHEQRYQDEEEKRKSRNPNREFNSFSGKSKIRKRKIEIPNQRIGNSN